jgi:hypothetical protein
MSCALQLQRQPGVGSQFRLPRRATRGSIRRSRTTIRTYRKSVRYAEHVMSRPLVPRTVQNEQAYSSVGSRSCGHGALELRAEYSPDELAASDLFRGSDAESV